MTRSPLFWFALGVGAYWGFQHFTGKGNTGKSA
jgi:hypothetical protein